MIFGNTVIRAVCGFSAERERENEKYFTQSRQRIKTMTTSKILDNTHCTLYHPFTVLQT